MIFFPIAGIIVTLLILSGLELSTVSNGYHQLRSQMGKLRILEQKLENQQYFEYKIQAGIAIAVGFDTAKEFDTSRSAVLAPLKEKITRLREEMDLQWTFCWESLWRRPLQAGTELFLYSTAILAHYLDLPSLHIIGLCAPIVKAFMVFDCHYLGGYFLDWDFDDTFPLKNYFLTEDNVMKNPFLVLVYGFNQCFMRFVGKAFPPGEDGLDHDVMQCVLFITILLFYSWSLLEASGLDNRALKWFHSFKTKKLKTHMTKEEKRKRPEQCWLHHACLYGHNATLKAILKCHKRSIDVNAKCYGQNTPLILACFGEHVQIVQMLMDHFGNDIDVTALNAEGESALDLAIESENLAIFRLLLRHKDLKTPKLPSLSLALINDVPAMVKVLCDRLRSQFKHDPEFNLELTHYLRLSKELENESLPTNRKRECLKKKDVYKKLLMIIVKRIEEKHLQRELLKHRSETQVTPDTESSAYECPVCLEDMVYPKQIMACNNDHLVCSECIQNSLLKACPICRDCFTKNPPKRRRVYEKWANATAVP